MTVPNEVVVTEVCPRDGFQSLPEIIETTEKVKIINDLISCGYKQIEITSFVHPKAIPQLKDAKEVVSQIKKSEGLKIRALVPNLTGLQRAVDAGVDKVKLMLSATDSHSLSNANCKTEDALNGFVPLMERAEESTVGVSGSISVAFGCPYEGEVPTKRLLAICEKYYELGIKEISLADTTGMANPFQIKKTMRKLKVEYPEMRFSLHLHNTRGMAFANAVAGLEEGVTDFDSSAAGLGGCPYAPNASGNIASEDLVHGFEEMGVRTSIDLDRVMEVSRYLDKKFNPYSDSFLLKAGKCSDLHVSPKKQIKLS